MSSINSWFSRLNESSEEEQFGDGAITVRELSGLFASAYGESAAPERPTAKCDAAPPPPRDWDRQEAGELKPARREPILIPIASGKGGVGKTNFAVNLAVALGETFPLGEKRVTLMDGDLGLPNADLVLGTRVTRNLEHFLRREVAQLEEIAEPTRFKNLHFIGGGTGASLGIANLYYQQKQKFIENILRVNTDYFILDLGASNSHLVVDFFSMVNTGIVILTPEPTAIRDAYQLIKSVVIRRLRQEFDKIAVMKDLINRFENPNDKRIATMTDLRYALEEESLRAEHPGLIERLDGILRPLRPRLVVNRAATVTESMEVAQRMGNTVRRHLGIETGYLGPILDDTHVTKAVRERVPFIKYAPHCKAAQSIEAIKRRLMDHEEFRMEANTSFLGSYLTKIWRFKEAV